MIAHDPSLVILSTTIAILGAFTACVMTSNFRTLSSSEARIRLIMACLALGGSIWAMHFVGLLSLVAPVNLGYNPIFLAASAVIAIAGTAISLFLVNHRSGDDEPRLPLAIAVFGITIAATHYSGLAAVAGRSLTLSWFLTAICIAVSLQVGTLVMWFMLRQRGVVLTLFGAVGLGLALTATHYLAVASAPGLDQTLATIPQDTNLISERYLAWSATIMMYLVCSICLCIFVLMQFREEIE